MSCFGWVIITLAEDTVRCLSRNNITITPDKAEGVVIKDSTHYNKKIIKLFKDKTMNKLHYQP